MESIGKFFGKKVLAILEGIVLALNYLSAYLISPTVMTNETRILRKNRTKSKTEIQSSQINNSKNN